PFPKQARGVIHRLVLCGAPHPSPDQEAERISMRRLDTQAYLPKFLLDLFWPLRMRFALPAQAEYAVAVLCYAAGGIDLHTDRYEDVGRRLQPVESFPKRAFLEAAQPLEDFLVAEERKAGLRGSVVE